MNEQDRFAAYMRDMSQDGPGQVNLIGQPRPPNLQRLLDDARRADRPFDVVLVAAMPVLGRPDQAQDVIGEFAAAGVRVGVVTEISGS